MFVLFYQLYGRKYVLNQNNVKRNMESKLTWMVLFLLGFIPCKITAGHGMKMSPYRMTWLESLSYCTLPDEESIHNLRGGIYRGWIGGIYSNTQWMMHKGKSQPKSDVDQQLDCSVIVPTNNTFVLKTVDCYSKFWTSCVISGVARPIGFTEYYQSSISRCSSLNGTILSTVDSRDDLVEGREYWSTIFRSRFLKWTTNESFNEICYEVDGLLNVDCVYLTVKYREIKYIPLPCKYKYTAICKPKQPGDPAVIRQCQTKMFTTASIKDEISTRERSTPSTKEEISAEESKFTSTTILTSSPERTYVTAFLASKKSTIFLAPSMPIKSIIVVASSTPSMSTDSKSTNLDYTKLVKRSSTKELHFSATTTLSIAVLVVLLVFVLVCLQVSLIAILRRHWRQTQEGNQYELTSQFTTEPRMYAQPEIQHYEVVDDIPSQLNI